MVFSKAKPTDATNGTTSKTAFRKLADFDDYIESKNRFDELQSERRELQATVDQLTAQIGEAIPMAATTFAPPLPKWFRVARRLRSQNRMFAPS